MSDVKKTIKGGATWQEVAEDRRRHRDATIAKVLPLGNAVVTAAATTGNLATSPNMLAAEELAVTNIDVEVLAGLLATGELTATAVIKAFLRRAGLAQKWMTNCVTELLPERALKRAEELDEHWAKYKEPVGPLHGIPISVKEHMAMKGLDLNAGFVAWVGRVAEEDALLLQILWDAGAVFYVRSTEPQTLMHLETSSNLYGVTTNPFNETLTSGGSSGGEGALVGVRGSILGIGTDIGGSIRSPAANNGVFGFKPTSGRLPVQGWAATMAGSESILGTIGPLSTSLEGIKLFMRTAIAGQPWLRSPNMVPLEWRDMSGLFNQRPLKVGVMWNDKVVLPHPPITRALRKVAHKLSKSGKVNVVHWEPQNHDRAWSIIAGLYFADGGDQEFQAIKESGEPMLPLSKWILDSTHVKKHDVQSLWDACAERDEYRRAYAELWNERDVDVILCPVGPSVAPKLNTARYWGYTAQWNLLDYPAVVFPFNEHITTDRQKQFNVTYTPRNDDDKYNWEQWEQHGTQGYEGAPISLQLVGRRFDDEKLLAALEIVLKEADLPTAVPLTPSANASPFI
ncbi:hypothetical protein PG999_008431, partial [Apiospora kogelbergensis]